VVFTVQPYHDYFQAMRDEALQVRLGLAKQRFGYAPRLANRNSLDRQNLQYAQSCIAIGKPDAHWYILG
jgi:hypothetical protein